MNESNNFTKLTSLFILLKNQCNTKKTLFGGEWGVYITLEGDGDQDSSSEVKSSGSESSLEGANFEYKDF